MNTSPAKAGGTGLIFFDSVMLIQYEMGIQLRILRYWNFFKTEYFSYKKLRSRRICRKNLETVDLRFDRVV